MDKLNLKTDFICRGFWYLPNNGNDRIPGILSFIANKEITLELFGDFNDQTPQIKKIKNNWMYKIILGDIDAGGNISLINCTTKTFTKHSSCSFVSSIYKPTYIVTGKLAPSISELQFCRARVQIKNLDFWCRPKLINITIPMRDGKEVDGFGVETIDADSKESICSVELDEKTTIELGSGTVWNFNNYGLQVILNQSTDLTVVKSTMCSLFDFMRDIGLFSQFLSLANLLKVESFNIFLYDRPRCKGTGSPICQLFYIQEKSPIASPHNFLFIYDQIKERFPEVIKKWFRLSSSIAPIRTHLVDSLTESNKFSSVDFTSIAYALDGYYERFISRERISLSNELNNLINRFKYIDIVNKMDIPVQQIVDTRNYYSHYFTPKGNQKILDGEELIEAYLQLKIILICCILEFTGLECSTINNIINKSGNYIFDKYH